MKKFLLILSFMLIAGFVSALEIPVKGSSGGGAKVSNGIIVVDMERLFVAHPMTARYKNALKNFADTRKKELDAMAADIKKEEDSLYNVGTQISEAQNKNDTAALDTLFKQFDETKKRVDDKKQKMADAAKKAKSDLIATEEKNSREVLKDIDVVLQDVIKKKDAQIVLDKASVLAGQGSNSEDITDEVIKRLKGR